MARQPISLHDPSSQGMSQAVRVALEVRICWLRSNAIHLG